MSEKIRKVFDNLEKEKFKKYELKWDEVYKRDLNNHFLTIKKVDGLYGAKNYQAIITKQNSKRVIWSMVADSLNKIKKDEVFQGLVKQYTKT